MERALAILALSLLPGVGERTVCRAVAHAARSGETIEELLRLPSERLRNDLHLSARALAALRDERQTGFLRARSLATRLAGDGVRFATPADPTYPDRLRCAVSPPPLIFLYGDPVPLASPTVALLSSREIAAHLLNALVLAARCAAAEEMSVVVGGMKSTHRIAASTARAARAPRIVVLDRGLLAAFGGNMRRDPFGLGPGRLPFAARSDLAISRFRPQDHAAPANGRKRDEMVVALGDLLFVAAARAGGEIERLCMIALDRGRSVLLWQGENRGLVAAGAQPIDDHDMRQGLRRFLAPSR